LRAEIPISCSIFGSIKDPKRLNTYITGMGMKKVEKAGNVRVLRRSIIPVGKSLFGLNLR